MSSVLTLVNKCDSKVSSPSDHVVLFYYHEQRFVSLLSDSTIDFGSIEINVPEQKVNTEHDISKEH